MGNAFVHEPGPSSATSIEDRYAAFRDDDDDQVIDEVQAYLDERKGTYDPDKPLVWWQSRVSSALIIKKCDVTLKRT